MIIIKYWNTKCYIIHENKKNAVKEKFEKKNEGKIYYEKKKSFSF